MSDGPVRKYSFVQLDVFSSRPLEGNPLAVFTDGSGLTDDEMQALAREMNLSETTFVFPRSPEVERERGVRVRIFTTKEELPFAGHPTLGTAVVLREKERASGQPRDRADVAAQSVSLELGVGKIDVTFLEDSEGGTFGEMRQPDPEFGALHNPVDVAALAGLQASDIIGDLPIQTVSTGVPFAVVPLKTLQAVRAVRLDWEKVRAYSQQHDGVFSFYFVSRKTSDRSAGLHARMIFSNGEDPATGSAAGCAAAWMVRYGVAQPEERTLIEQGIEIRRPSRIFVRAGRDGERVTNVRVGGYAAEVLRGEVRL